MDLNLTLVGQMITFMVLILVVYRYLLPSLRSAILARQQKIDEGINAGRTGEQRLRAAAELIDNRMASARKRADSLLTKAQLDANKILTKAQDQGLRMCDNYLLEARRKLEQEAKQTRQDILNEQGEVLSSAIQHLLSLPSGATLNAKTVQQALLNHTLKQL